MKRKKRTRVADVVSVKIGPMSSPPAPERPLVVAPSANDTQVGGGHYKARAIEPWDIVAVLGLDPFQADILYYILRWKEKGGLEDLEKAGHWLQKYVEVERLRKEFGDHGMRAALLEAAARKVRARADEADRDAGLYFGAIRTRQSELAEHITSAFKKALVRQRKNRRRAKR